jgi:hypothetical protein
LGPGNLLVCRMICIWVCVPQAPPNPLPPFWGDPSPGDIPEDPQPAPPLPPPDDPSG